MIRPTIRPLTSPDAVEPLREVARTEGFLFLDRLVEEWRTGINAFDRPGEILLGAFADRQLVATAGLTRQGPHLGRVRRVYVHPLHRREGIASALMKRVIDFASGHYAEIVLFTDTTVASEFYRRLGFVPESASGPDRATHRLVTWPI